MAKLTVTFKGARQIEKKLKNLSEAVAKKNLLQSIEAASRPMERSMIDKAPVSSGPYVTQSGRRVSPGRLRSSIRRETISSTRFVAEIGIGPTAWYAHFLEFGTSSSNKRSWGTRAQPFVRPAFDEEVGRSMTIFAKEINRRIQKAT